MLRRMIETWLLTSLILLLVGATATMGMRAGAGRYGPSGISGHAHGFQNALIRAKSLPDGTTGLPVQNTASGNVCCACDVGETCSVEIPETRYARLFRAGGATLAEPLAFEPPAAPPRT